HPGAVGLHEGPQEVVARPDRADARAAGPAGRLHAGLGRRPVHLHAVLGRSPDGPEFAEAPGVVTEGPEPMKRVFLRMQALAAFAAATFCAAPLSTFAEQRPSEVTGVRAVTVAMLGGHPQRRGPSPEAVLIEMNRERKRRGLPALYMSRSLNAAAEDRLGDMFEQAYFAHDA